MTKSIILILSFLVIAAPIATWWLVRDYWDKDDELNFD